MEGGDEGVSWLLVMETQSSREREPTPVGQQNKAPSEPPPSVSNNIAKVHRMCDNLKPRSPYLVMGLETPRENPTKGAACTDIPHGHRGQNTLPLPPEYFPLRHSLTLKYKAHTSVLKEQEAAMGKGFPDPMCSGVSVHSH